MRVLLALRNGRPSFQSRPTLVAIRTRLRCPPSASALPHDLLRAAEAIDRRRIDERDAAIDSLMNGTDRLCFIGSAPHPSADRPCAERNGRHLERRAGNVDKLHVDFGCFGLKGHDLPPPRGFCSYAATSSSEPRSALARV